MPTENQFPKDSAWEQEAERQEKYRVGRIEQLTDKPAELSTSPPMQRTTAVDSNSVEQINHGLLAIINDPTASVSVVAQADDLQRLIYQYLR